MNGQPAGKPNLWGTVPQVVEMQSEGGAAGAVHGALQSGALSTTFTASQGLLLMIPNMYKIAGELTPTVFHIAARALASHALSIFGDHQDVMSTRATGFAMLSSTSVQEVMDMALISQAATLEGASADAALLRRFPHLARSCQDRKARQQHRASHDAGSRRLRVTACVPCPPTAQSCAAHRKTQTFTSSPKNVPTRTLMPCLALCRNRWTSLPQLTGRQYKLFQYVGAPDAERVIVLMGSGCETAHETVDHMLSSR